MVGEGPCQDELRLLAEELGIIGTVRFLGQRRDLNEILPACDLFVLSSISEGLSYAILEAMACGLPVVATRVGGNSELVEEEVTGLLTPPQDPAALSRALISLLDNPGLRLRMGERGRHFVELRHDAAKSAEQYLRLYRKMVDGARQGRSSFLEGRGILDARRPLAGPRGQSTPRSLGCLWSDSRPDPSAQPDRDSLDRPLGLDLGRTLREG